MTSNCGIVAYGGTVAFCSNQIPHHLWIHTKQIAPNNTKSHRSPHCCDCMIPEVTRTSWFTTGGNLFRTWFWSLSAQIQITLAPIILAPIILWILMRQAWNYLVLWVASSSSTFWSSSVNPRILHSVDCELPTGCTNTHWANCTLRYCLG